MLALGELQVRFKLKQCWPPAELRLPTLKGPVQSVELKSALSDGNFCYIEAIYAGHLQSSDCPLRSIEAIYVGHLQSSDCRL